MSCWDDQKGSVYDAHERLSAHVAAGAPVRVDGVTYRPEPDEEYSTLAAAQLTATLLCIEQGLPPVTVRHRNGDTRSHYEPGTATIALAPWGGNRLTLAHELAHHAAYTRCGVLAHDQTWRTMTLQIMDAAGAPIQSALLAALWRQQGLTTARAL